jgi:hypothetical protein
VGEEMEAGIDRVVHRYSAMRQVARVISDRLGRVQEAGQDHRHFRRIARRREHGALEGHLARLGPSWNSSPART